MENETKKRSIENGELANVSGGVPGELICRAASNVVSMLFSMSKAEHTGSVLSDSIRETGKAARSK